MKRGKIEILKEEIQIPEVVNTAAEEAFDKILREAAQSKETQNTEVTVLKKAKPRFKKKWIALVAVAVLAAGTLSVGAATGFFDGNMKESMGIDQEDAYLTAKTIEMNESDTCTGVDYSVNASGEKKDVTMTVAKTIGDETTAYILIETDYELPEGFDPEVQQIEVPFTEFGIYRDESMSSNSEVYWNSCKVEYLVENNKLGILLRVGRGDDINDAYVRVGFENIYIQAPTPSGEDTLLFEGSWSMQWEYDYETQDTDSATYDLDANVHMPYAKIRDVEDNSIITKGLDVNLTQITFTPLTLTLDGTLEYGPETEFLENAGVLIEKVTYTDGTVIKFDESRLEDGTKFDSAYGYNAVLRGCTPDNELIVRSEVSITDLFGQSLDLEKLESITINGVDIKLK